jgi:hypothetical protein
VCGLSMRLVASINLSQHADLYCSERPVLLALDQQLVCTAGSPVRRWLPRSGGGMDCSGSRPRPLEGGLRAEPLGDPGSQHQGVIRRFPAAPPSHTHGCVAPRAGSIPA